MANRRSLYLNENWDIGLNDDGNLATTSGEYCDAQNVANAIRLFTHDAYLAQQDGVPHFSIDLGVPPALSEVRSWYRKQALNVDNIRAAEVTITGVDADTRTMRGQVTCINEDNIKMTIEI